MKLTPSLARALDSVRGLTLGRKARLVLLDHDPDRGYESIIEVKRGWLVSDQTREGTGELKLEIAESAEATAELLRTCAAFAFQQSHEESARVCAIESRREPTGEISRIWEFGITPSGELFTIQEP